MIGRILEWVLRIVIIIAILAIAIGILMENRQWRIIILIIAWVVSNPILSCLTIIAVLFFTGAFLIWLARRRNET